MGQKPLNAGGRGEYMWHQGNVIEHLVAKTAGVTGRMLKDDSGATVIEYGMIVGLVSVAIMGTLLSLSATLGEDVYGVVSDAMSDAVASGEDG